MDKNSEDKYRPDVHYDNYTAATLAINKAERNKTVHKEIITQYYPLHGPLNTERKLILCNKLQSVNSPNRRALNIIIGTRPILHKHLFDVDVE